MIWPLSKSGSPAAPGSSTNPTGRTTGEAASRPTARTTRPMAGGNNRDRAMVVRRRCDSRRRCRFSLPSVREYRTRRRTLWHPLSAGAPPPSRRGSGQHDGCSRAHPASGPPDGLGHRPRCRLSLGKHFQQPASECVRRPISRRRLGQRPQSLAQLTLSRHQRRARRTVLDVALDRGDACQDQLPGHAPARRSRPATSGTSCEVPHAPERPVGGPSDARHDL